MPQTLTANGFMGVDSRLSFRVCPISHVSDAAANDESESPDRRRAAWMAAAQAGDRRAYEKLLADSIALIRIAARRQGVAVDHLDDVVQETLITVHRVRHTYDPARSYDAWLSAIASRRAIDALRSRGRRDSREVHDEFAVERHADVDDASAATELGQRAQHLRAAIAELPPGQREAVEQLGLQEHSLQEAEELTGRKSGALKVNLHRALKSLRERFQGEP
ncbi:sigma-70 family RNA polymerase sigma factor [Rhodanobacter sp. L36]|uniref:RNA polymerase sigma factor n=1 Tax=Rhodanobacter sp. L36 TaxID=1747221 RepID=UPI00131D7D99|nr:sigma-70 family RNA polymerase sigma factor [Rhodanobacter sp. L36]